MQKKTQQMDVRLSSKMSVDPARSARMGTGARVRSCIVALSMAAAACAPVPAPDIEPIGAGLYQMPNEMGAARKPEEVRPDRAAELAEAALGLLNPERPGGPDYGGAARMCLMAAEIASQDIERELRGSCYRVAARSALRSGDQQMYLEAVDAWERNASRVELASGELLIHTAIRDRLRGLPVDEGLSDPMLRRLLELESESAP